MHTDAHTAAARLAEIELGGAEAIRHSTAKVEAAHRTILGMPRIAR